MRKVSDASDSNQSEDEEVVCSLKIKHKNRVKKIPSLPTKFAKLNNIVKKKYEEFKEGKPTYSMSYLDEENELINISDEEDYLVFKEFVEDKGLTTAKVFLSAKGEEKNFDPAIDDNKTICESMIVDDFDRTDRNFCFPPTPVRYMPSTQGPEPFPYQILDSLKKQIDYLVEKDKKDEAKKNKKKEDKEAKEAIKKAKQERKKLLEKAKKEKEQKKKEEKDKKKKDKAKANAKEKEPNKDIEIDEIKSETTSKVDIVPKPVLTESKEIIKPIAKDDHKESSDIIEEEKHEFAIQPCLKRKDDKKIEPKENLEIVKNEEDKEFLCEECKTKLGGKIQYRCSICGEYCICEACEINTKHQHIFIKVPINVKFDKDAYDEFCQKLLGIYADNINNEDKIPEAIINERKSASELKTRTMNVKKASNLSKDKYKDGVIAKPGELVELEWEVKNFTSNDWPNNVTIECLPTSDIIIDEQLTHVAIKSGQKGKFSVKFYAPRDTKGKEKLDVDFGLFEDTKTLIGDTFKVKLIVSS